MADRLKGKIVIKVEDAGKAGEVWVVSFDFVDETMAYVQTGVIYGTIGQDPAERARPQRTFSVPLIGFDPLDFLQKLLGRPR